MIIKKCLIIHSYQEVINEITASLASFPFLEFYTVSTFEKALGFLLRQNFDLVFLAVDLKGKNGLNLLKFLPSTPKTIVVSSNTTHALEAYEIDNIVDYLVTPLDAKKLQEKVSKALNVKLLKSGFITDNYCLLKIGTKMKKIDFDHINYIEGYGTYCKIHYEDRVLVNTETLTAMDKNLPGSMFTRVHKSYIVNLHKISKIDHKTCTIMNRQIPLGNTYLPNIKPLIQLFKHPKIR